MRKKVEKMAIMQQKVEAMNVLAQVMPLIILHKAPLCRQLQRNETTNEPHLISHLISKLKSVTEESNIQKEYAAKPVLSTAVQKTHESPSPKIEEGGTNCNKPKAAMSNKHFYSHALNPLNKKEEDIGVEKLIYVKGTKTLTHTRRAVDSMIKTFVPTEHHKQRKILYYSLNLFKPLCFIIRGKCKPGYYNPIAFKVNVNLVRPNNDVFCNWINELPNPANENKRCNFLNKFIDIYQYLRGYLITQPPFY